MWACSVCVCACTSNLQLAAWEESGHAHCLCFVLVVAVPCSANTPRWMPVTSPAAPDPALKQV